MTVESVNDAPVLESIGNRSVLEDHSISIELEASDVDNEAESLIFEVTSGIQITATIVNQVLTLTPATNFFGEEQFTISVSDGDALDEEIFNVTVQPVNDAPMITSTAGTIVTISETYRYQIEFSDPDDTTVTYELQNAPDGMIVSEAGAVTWAPLTGVLTSGAVTIVVTDSGGLMDTELFTVSVVQTDCAGVIGGTAEYDDCNICSGSTSGHEPNSDIDDCGVCFGENLDMDCAGVCFGTAVDSECGCIGGTTGFEDGYCLGCTDDEAMNFNPDAFVDDGTCMFAGDLNNSGTVDIFDIILLVELYLSGEDPSEFQLQVCDLVSDGTLNILDLMAIVDIIMNQDLNRLSPVGNADIIIHDRVVTVSTDGDIAAIEIWIDEDEYIVDTLLPKDWNLYQNAGHLIILNMSGETASEVALFRLSDVESTIESTQVADWFGNLMNSDIKILPSAYRLGSAFPNPFNPATTLDYAIPDDNQVSIEVYDLQGRQVAELFNGWQSAGQHQVGWHAENQATGVYIIRMVSGDFSQTRKVMLVNTY